jgi:hypothetical protein
MAREDYRAVQVRSPGRSRPSRPASGWTEVERRAITGQRWWSEGELAATTDRFYPEEIVALLRRLGVFEPSPD